MHPVNMVVATPPLKSAISKRHQNKIGRISSRKFCQLKLSWNKIQLARAQMKKCVSRSLAAKKIGSGVYRQHLVFKQFLWLSKLYSNKKAELSLGKMHYSLYSSCCSTDLQGYPRSTIFISFESPYATSHSDQ